MKPGYLAGVGSKITRSLDSLSPVEAYGLCLIAALLIVLLLGS